MQKEVISANAPQAIGPYSQGVISGSFIFVSGQLPVDPNTGLFAGPSIVDQAAQSLENVKAILTQAKSSMDKVVKTTVFLSDMNDFPVINEVYAKYFNGPVLPARACVEVAKLPKGASIEIEVIAML